MVTYTLDTATPLTQLLAETTGPDTTLYLHGLGLVTQSDGVTTEYFSADGLGSVRQLTDSSGSVLLNQTFDPYGNPYVRTGLGDTRFGFTGEQVDGNGLVYLRARYYNPSHGRFLNADPSRQERNPYQYAYSNPTKYTDPSGLQPPDIYDFEVADEIVRQYRKVSDVEALAQLFVNPRLDVYPHLRRQNAYDRLKYIFEITESGGAEPWVQFGIDFGESGLKCEYQDGWLYDLNGWLWHRVPGKNGPGDPGLKTNQIGHFLTAARLGFETRNPLNAPIWYAIELRLGPNDQAGRPFHEIASRLITGHELLPDSVGPVEQYQHPTREELDLWNKALSADRTGNEAARDSYLWTMFLTKGTSGEPYHTTYTLDPHTWGRGNSVSDLKLSVKGYRFGLEIGCAQSLYASPGIPLCTRSDAARWLRHELMGA